MDEFRESLKPENYDIKPIINDEQTKKVTVKIEKNYFLNLIEYISEIRNTLTEMPDRLLDETGDIKKVDIEDIKDIFGFATVEASFGYSEGKLTHLLNIVYESLNSMLEKVTDEDYIEVDRQEILTLKGQMQQVKESFLDMAKNLKEINSESFLEKFDDESRILETFLDNSDKILEDIVPEDNGMEHE